LVTMQKACHSVSLHSKSYLTVETQTKKAYLTEGELR
jgi:hypothetical protein